MWWWGGGGQPPVTQPPVTQPPVTPPPVTQPPVTQPPVTQPPVTQPPVTPPTPPEPVDIIQRILNNANSIENSALYSSTNQGTNIVENLLPLEVSNVDAHDFSLREEDQVLYGIPMGESNDYVPFGDNYTIYSRLGGWLDYSYFEAELILGFVDPLATYHVNALSLGDATGRNPVQGTATWRGGAAGYDLRRFSLAHPWGAVEFAANARVSVDFADADVDVVFTNFVHRGLGSGSRTVADRGFYNMPMTNGSFRARTTTAGRLSGMFYGPNHEEVGGEFVIVPTRNYEERVVVGAFGAKREN